MQLDLRGNSQRDLIQIIVLILLSTGGLTIMPRLVDGDATHTSTLWQRIAAGTVLSLLITGAIVAWTRRTSARPGPDAGFNPPRKAIAMFGIGFAAWLVPAAAIFLVLGLLGSPLSVSGDGSEVASRIALLLFAVLLSEAIPEEMVFRGYTLGVLNRLIGEWSAILVQAVFFVGMALALRGYTGMLDLSMFITMGIAFGYLRLLTGSVWTSIGFHTAFQTGSQLLLTHDVVNFTGSRDLEMLALGAGPFTIGLIALSVLRPAPLTATR